MRSNREKRQRLQQIEVSQEELLLLLLQVYAKGSKSSRIYTCRLSIFSLMLCFRLDFFLFRGDA